MNNKTIVVALSGASGSIYGIRLIKALIDLEINVFAILSNAAKKVLSHEMEFNADKGLKLFLKDYGVALVDEGQIEVFSQHEMDSASASGSFLHSGMVVAPCSMKTLSAISAGYADNLITRSADVCLKEKRPLILLPRETPHNQIHLENMLRANKAGAVIMPANPSFYSQPKTIDDLADTVIARVLDHLSIDHTLLSRWGF